MDDRRFDNAARWLARYRSRRTLLGGLAGSGALFIATHLRLPGAAARRGTKSQGEPCWDDAQCVAADTALVCAWNGYGSAGAACCAYDGSRCGDDAGCCGYSICSGGFCTSQAASYPAPGEPCQQGVDVCVAASGYFYCGYVPLADGWRCCTDVGNRCGWDAQCCGFARCSDQGICVPLEQ
jgi:hypothetical protein